MRHLSELRDKLIETAKKYLGVPFKAHDCSYSHIVQDPIIGFDCSGYVRRVLHDAGIVLPLGIIHTRELFDNFGKPISEAETGDLVFFSKYGAAPGHVAIVVDDERVIHATRLIGSVGYSTFDELQAKFPKIFTSNPIGYRSVNEYLYSIKLL